MRRINLLTAVCVAAGVAFIGGALAGVRQATIDNCQASNDARLVVSSTLDGLITALDQSGPSVQALRKSLDRQRSGGALQERNC